MHRASERKQSIEGGIGFDPGSDLICENAAMHISSLRNRVEEKFQKDCGQIFFRALRPSAGHLQPHFQPLSFHPQTSHLCSLVHHNFLTKFLPKISQKNFKQIFLKIFGVWHLHWRIFSDLSSPSSSVFKPLGVDWEVMLEKQWMGQQVDRSICGWFWEQAYPARDSFKVPSVIASPTHYLLHIVREGITFLACTQYEMPPLLGIEFLCRVANVLSDYLGGLNEDLIKDNFVIVYQLLDEMMDSGFPLTTEPNILKDMIAPPNIVSRMLSVVTGGSSSVSSTLPGATASNVPWRASDLKHSNNEVYVDLVEEIDAIINRDGFLVKCEVYGEVQVISRLSGIPDLTLSFANPSIINDVRFHPCVRFRPWETRQVLSFVPPDGEFKLMSYRVKKLKNTPIYVRPQLTSDAGLCRVNILVGMRNDPGKPIDSIALQFSLPPSVVSSDLTANHGSFNVLTNKACTWSIGRIPKDKTPCLTGTLRLESGVDCLREFPTLLVGFKIMGIGLSGLKIDKLDLQNVVYRPFKGFRAVTRAGNYEIRT